VSTIELALSEAELWESGCRSDTVRNGFVIPELVRRLKAEKPASVLDVGTGTGYVPRMIDSQLTSRPAWTLVDVNRSRLDVAIARCSQDMRYNAIVSDIFTCKFDRAFDAVLATFTLLEIDDTERLIALFSGIVRSQGILVITLPDAWHDVLETEPEHDARVREYLQGRTSISKIDKFTGEAYPFRAVRIEQLISNILAAGFELFSLVSRAGDQSVYILSFRRLAVV
jgi:ubiquinone/menaquinone biosynthesis C-methylase UbiE